MIVRAFVNVARGLFGEWRWTPPPWAKSSARIAQQGRAAAGRYPERSIMLAALLALLVVGGYAGWKWYQRQPKPVEFAVTVTEPERTCIECKPPGKPNPVSFNFTGSVAPLADFGKAVDPAKAGLHVSPAVAGQWRWRDDRTLEFTPAAEWPYGREYTLEFARKGFTAPQVHLQEYTVKFHAPPFTASVDSSEFYQDPVQATDKKIVTTLAFSQPVDSALLQRKVTLRLYQKINNEREEEVLPAPGFTLGYDKLKLHAYLQSSQLAVLPKGGRVQVEIGSGLRAAAGGNETAEPLRSSVAVPGLYSLAVPNIELAVARDERDTPSQALLISTSHSVTQPEITTHVKAWLLPIRHPDSRMQADFEKYNKKDWYRWRRDLVTPAVLAASEPVTLDYVANEREHVEQHSFRLRAEPRREIYVRVDKGLKSFGGYLMAESVDRVLSVPDYPREVHIAWQGSLLSLSGPKKLLLESRDVKSVHVQVGRLLPDQLQHLVTQSRGDFSHPQFSNYYFSAANITERFEQTIDVPVLPDGAASYQALDLSTYLGKPGDGRQGIFLLDVQAWDPVHKRAVRANNNDGQVEDTRLIVVTDLGLIAKRSVDGSQDVFVQSIAGGEPLADVSVEIIGRNGEPVVSRSTDAAGHVRFPDLRSYKNEREPVLYLARRGGDSSFLPIGTHVDALDLSRFEVGGVSNKAEAAALSAYLFSDRGIYRPGDAIHAGAIIKAQDWRKLPEGLPLRFEITDPRGVSVKRELVHLGAAGFEELSYQTREAAPVGAYTLSVYLLKSEERQELIGTMTVKVQEFLPDRLKMTTRFSEEQAEGWVAPDKLQAQIDLQNLFGTPAAGRRVRASMHLSPAAVSFARYRDYQFHDPQAAREGFAENLAEQTTADDGHASFELNLGRFTRATYQVGLAVQGFEADGGRAVSGEATQLVSNLPFLVGWKADGRLDFIPRGSARSVEFIAVDPRLARIAAGGLRLKRLERRYVSVLLRQDSGVYKYESRLKEVPIDEREFALPGGSAKVALDSATPGNFSALVVDAAGQEYARVDYTIAGAANLTRSMEKNAELQIVLDRKDYAPGDTISMQIQAPYTGAGLITIERDHVYSWQWFRTTTLSSVQKIRVPEGLEGNGYVSVSFVRDPASEEIYTAPLSYGVQPFSIALDARRDPVTLEVPKLVKPGETLRIGYRAARPARMALFAVDEGILQVARYQTPDPLGHFFQKRSLDVSTRQILDLILPGFKPAMLSAPGGDQQALLAANLNPFKRKTDKPVVWWAGLVDAGPTAQQATWQVPDYFNGRLRVIAIAVNDSSIGTAEQAATVRGDFVLSPNAPLTVTPGDEFEVSLGVANNVADSGKDATVSLSLKPSAQLEVVGAAQSELRISAMHESTAHFRLRARDALGSASLEFRASLGTHSARSAATLSVRPASPYISMLNAGRFKGKAHVAVARDMYPEFRKREASLSTLPLVLAHGLSAWLGRYPYSCTEQLVSMAMPGIVLAHRPEFGELKSDNGATLAGLIDELRARQTGDGSFRYWAGGVESIDFVSVYALHVLMEAGERGEPVPADLQQSGRGFLLRLARADGDSLDDERTGAYAIYLLARQGVVVSNEAAAMQKRLDARYKNWSGDIVAAYLASAYQLMQQKLLADRLMANVTGSGWSDGDRWHDGMANDAMLLYLTAKHFPYRLNRLPDSILDTMVQHVQRDEFNSLTAATTILALDTYATATAGPLGNPGFTLRATLADKSTTPIALPDGLFPKVPLAPEVRALDLGSSTLLPNYYLVNESGFDRKPAQPPLTQGLEIIREYLDASGKPVQSVKLGNELTVHVRFRAIGHPMIGDAVLVDLLPGGFDLVVPNAPSEGQALLSVTPDSASAEGAEEEGGDEGEGRGGCLCLWLYLHPANFPDFADLREDRVVLYGSATDQVQEYSYRIKATNIGSYAVPPAFGESMYDPAIRARSAAARISVTPP